MPEDRVPEHERASLLVMLVTNHGEFEIGAAFNVRIITVDGRKLVVCDIDFLKEAWRAIWKDRLKKRFRVQVFDVAGIIEGENNG